MGQSVHKIIEDGGEQYLGWALAQERRLRQIGPAASAKHSFDDADVTVRVIGRQSYIHIKGKEDGHGYYFFPRSQAYPNGDNQTDSTPPQSQPPYGIITEKLKVKTNQPEMELGEFDWVGKVGGKKYVVTLPHVGGRYQFGTSFFGTTYFVGKEKYTAPTPPIAGLAITQGLEAKTLHVAACLNPSYQGVEIWAKEDGEWEKRGQIPGVPAGRVFFSESGKRLCYLVHTSNTDRRLVSAEIGLNAEVLSISDVDAYVQESVPMSTDSPNPGVSGTGTREAWFVPSEDQSLAAMGYGTILYTTSIVVQMKIVKGRYTYGSSLPVGTRKKYVIACDFTGETLEKAEVTYDSHGILVVLEDVNYSVQYEGFHPETGIEPETVGRFPIGPGDDVEFWINAIKEEAQTKANSMAASSPYGGFIYTPGGSSVRRVNPSAKYGENSYYRTQPRTVMLDVFGKSYPLAFHGGTRFVTEDVMWFDGGDFRWPAPPDYIAGINYGEIDLQPNTRSDLMFLDLRYGAICIAKKSSDKRNFQRGVMKEYPIGLEVAAYIKGSRTYVIDAQLTNVSGASFNFTESHLLAEPPPSVMNLVSGGVASTSANFASIDIGKHALLFLELASEVAFCKSADPSYEPAPDVFGSTFVGEINSDAIEQFQTSRLEKYKALTGANRRLDPIKLF